MRISVTNEANRTEISIPLLNTQRKELYTSIRVPSRADKIFIFIKPEAQYFITNAQNLDIGYLTETDYKKCWQHFNSDTKSIYKQLPAICKEQWACYF